MILLNKKQTSEGRVPDQMTPKPEKHTGNEAVAVLTQAAIPLLETTGYGVEMAVVKSR